MRVWKLVGGFFLLVIAIVIVMGVRILRHGFDAHKAPSNLETTVARKLRHLAIPKIDREEENPWATVATPQVMKDAREHFADHCAQCHANDGSGDVEMGKGLYPKAPDMRLPATQNLTDGELYYIITRGVPLTGMPAWGDLTYGQDDESWQLVLFIRHLPHLTDAEIAEMKLYNPVGKMMLEDMDADGHTSEEAPGKTPEHVH
jgi:mono/diheme cytochrome c family protein